MRWLLPPTAEPVDLAVAYGVPKAGGSSRPFVRVNMISSLDGAIAVQGRSGGLGGPGDRRLFQVLRSLADVILVGAGTARTESYGPARLDEELIAQRLERGQAELPPIAVVTRSCHLDWSAPFFTQAAVRPLVITTHDCDAKARARAAAVAEVLLAGDGAVDLDDAIRRLGEHGFDSVLAEGGPRLDAQLVSLGLLDELCLTLSPCLVGGEGPRILAGPSLPEPLHLELVHLLEEDGFLFARLRVGRDGPTVAGR